MSGLLIFLVLVVMVVGAFIVACMHNAEKLMYGVPWLKWLTFDEIVDMGHSKFWAEMLLPMFSHYGSVEIRISDRLSDSDHKQAEKRGLHIDTAALYEYKFTEKSGGGRKDPTKLLLPDFPQPMRL